jgi:hypothetical protein
MVLSSFFYCLFFHTVDSEGCNEETSLQFVKAFYSSLATGAEKSSHDLLCKFTFSLHLFLLLIHGWFLHYLSDLREEAATKGGLNEQVCWFLIGSYYAPNVLKCFSYL